MGRFAPHKGLNLLLDAFAAYSAADPTCHLALAGVPGPFDVAAHRARLKPEAAARVHVIEKPSDAQLKGLYQGCTAYVSASQHEGFCVPLAEALGFEKPVFAFDTPAVRETLGEAGWLFTERDPAALAALWRSVLLEREGLEERAVGIRARGAALRSAADGRLLWRALADAARRTA
ncbi:MAG: glycosyltransferase [Deltaproteobacteria bacterium]|nr:glycosyltransferase [Deltaproteobacteria bacterium]